MNRTFSIAIAAAALLTTACAGDEQPQTAGTANGFAAPTKSGTLAKGREVVFTDDMIAGLVSETSQLLFSAGIEPGELLDDDDTALFTFGDSVPLRLPVTRELPDTKEQRLLYIHRGVGYSYFVFGGAEDEAWSRFVAHLSATGRIITLPDPPAPSDLGDNPADGFLPQSPWENCGEMALTRLPVEALRTPLDSERLYIVRDAEALEALARIDREIDFSAHTVLAFRIETPNGICRLTSALARTDGGYLYRVRVSMFETDVIGDEPLFVLAPRIGEHEEVRFEYGAEY